MSLNLVFEGALSRLFDLIDVMSETLIPFAESIIGFMTQPIAEAVNDLLSILLDIPILGDVVSWLTSGLLSAIFGDMTIPEFIFGYGITFYLVYTIGKWITDLFL